LVTSCVAFKYVENEYLHKAITVLEMSGLTRKDVSGRMLQDLSSEDKVDLQHAIKEMEFPAGSSDGWRKKHCLSGAGLMNFMVMGKQTGESIMGGSEHAARFGGWTLDNTRAKVLAIEHLEKQHPQLVNVGCMAHATSLAIKDFCRLIKTPGRFSVTYGIAWMQTVATSSNTIANFVQDSGSAIAIIQPEMPGDEPASKRARKEVKPVGTRKEVWKRYGKKYPALTGVALRLLSIHPSAASERSWSLWGRVYTSSRNALGLERAKALITFCFNDRCRKVDQQDFGLLLSVVEGECAKDDQVDMSK
jgi:hypothetical protein